MNGNSARYRKHVLIRHPRRRSRLSCPECINFTVRCSLVCEKFFNYYVLRTPTRTYILSRSCTAPTCEETGCSLVGNFELSNEYGQLPIFYMGFSQNDHFNLVRDLFWFPFWKWLKTEYLLVLIYSTIDCWMTDLCQGYCY